MVPVVPWAQRSLGLVPHRLLIQLPLNEKRTLVQLVPSKCWMLETSDAAHTSFGPSPQTVPRSSEPATLCRAQLLPSKCMASERRRSSPPTTQTSRGPLPQTARVLSLLPRLCI